MKCNSKIWKKIYVNVIIRFLIFEIDFIFIFLCKIILKFHSEMFKNNIFVYLITSFFIIVFLVPL